MIRRETHSPDETRLIGRALGAAAEPGAVLLLRGDLGSGKTTLAQGIGEALGAFEVNSPTFILVAEHRGRIPLFHVDLYRLGDVDDISDLALDEVIGRIGVVVVEWPERYHGEWPEDRLEIALAGEGETRTLTFTPTGPRHRALLRRAGIAP
ncbi:MAG: tRNA (adenosine(37)-N6)-threonylcarbamoyltransferase complex ATPase subunit type 1 TsaE [Dehalococcoidia bacterium]|nr:MAG: tRNA (adenosine(37)-N6)-threonylcarbamoyltransferase complex ATPase subunit type 1 TsaE [Dehalococcoidia bacterium]